MQNIVSKKSIFRKPSHGELIFLAILIFFFGGLGGLGNSVPFAPFDWLQQNATAWANKKNYDGDGILVSIDDDTFAKLERNEWRRADLAALLTKISDAKPRQIVVDRQYFASDNQAGIDQLRQTLASLSVEVFWQVSLAPDDIAKTGLSDPPTTNPYNTDSPKLDPGAKGLARPVVTAYRSYPLSAPLLVAYAFETDKANYPSAAQVLSRGNRPHLNLFDVDLSYDPASIPSLSAHSLLEGSFDTSELRDKRVIVSFTNNLARDVIQTPNSAFASRGAAMLMAAQTLNSGPPIRIGWVPSLLFGLVGALAWVFLPTPWGRWIALTVVFSILVSTLVLEQHLIFQSTSQGVFLILVLAIGKVWMRGREAVKTYRGAAETKSRFLAQASHDLRQPIHAIGLLSERLLQTNLSTDQAEIVSKISWSVDNASRMFRSLLDIAAIESGTLQKYIEPVSINELLAEIDSQNALAAEQAGIDLRLVPSNLIVQTDRALVGTMLQNLVSNAIKYSPGKKVLIGCRKRANRVSIHVIDNGRGISKSELKHVKKEFYRSSSKSTLGTESKGLGLAIVNRLALMLNLEFILSSQAGKGTAASISGLRLAANRIVAEDERKSHKLPLSGLRVALADDDQETLKSTAKLLEQWGCEVTSFHAFPEQRLNCDILLSDFDFGDGITLASHTAAISEIENLGVRLIIVSGHHPDHIRECIPGATDLILSKPLRAAELRSALMSARVG